MYNSDNSGKLVPNCGTGEQGGTSPFDSNLRPGQPYAQWCPGREDTQATPPADYLSPVNLPNNSPNVGWEWIQAGLIYPYVNNVLVYQCPSDQSYNTFFNVRYPHVRSMSMNAWLSPFEGEEWTGGSADSKLRVFLKETDLNVPGPANTWLLVDENPDSINDAWMVEDPTEPSIEEPEWVDCPASYHDGACGMSFTDGHAVIKKWRDPVILAVNQMDVPASSPWSYGTPSKYLPDIFWMVNRSTALKTTQAFLGPN
jgi:hypothetical protein